MDPNVTNFLTALAAILTAVGAWKGGAAAVNRFRGSSASQMPEGNGGATVTNPGIVTDTYCKEQRGEIKSDIKEVAQEIKKSNDDLAQEVKGLALEVAGLDGKIYRAANKVLEKHEDRFLHGSSAMVQARKKG